MNDEKKVDPDVVGESVRAGIGIITCSGCKVTAEHNCGSDVGRIAEVTGYNPAMLQPGVFVYVCPACWRKVRGAVATLFGVFSNDWQRVYLRHLAQDMNRNREPLAAWERREDDVLVLNVSCEQMPGNGGFICHVYRDSKWDARGMVIVGGRRCSGAKTAQLAAEDVLFSFADTINKLREAPVSEVRV